MIVYLRNVHATQTVHLPIRPGWCRVLKPAVTTAVPAALLHTSEVRQLLLRRLVDLVDGAAWDADVRQRRASRTDWARAIAAAEQREFDKLRAGLPPGHEYYWSAEQIERIRHRIAAGATMKQLATEHGLTRQAMDQLCRRHGLLTRLAASGGGALARTGDQSQASRPRARQARFALLRDAPLIACR